MRITAKRWRAALAEGRKKRCVYELDVLGKECKRVSAGMGVLYCNYYETDRRKCPYFILDKGV